MLVRTRKDGGAECIMQAHHALLSGVLAAAWRPTRLPPRVVQAIGWHDDPWRPVDREPTLNAESGWPEDFVDVSVEQKVEFYREGIDSLEEVDPYVAYLVSRHYTTFAGTRDVEALCEPERQRRERLKSRLSARQLQETDRAIAWMKYFDVWSLYLCLGGPAADDAAVPRWLDPVENDWLEAPDGTEPSFEWLDDTTVDIDAEGASVGGEPGVFGDETLGCPIEFRYLDAPCDEQRQLSAKWWDAPIRTRHLDVVSTP